MNNQDNQTKIYRFTQQLLNYQEGYFEMEGTFNEIMWFWYCNPQFNKMGLTKNKIESYLNEFIKIEKVLKKQKVFIEIVDDSCYSCGWITKIEEI